MCYFQLFIWCKSSTDVSHRPYCYDIPMVTTFRYSLPKTGHVWICSSMLFRVSFLLPVTRGEGSEFPPLQLRNRPSYSHQNAQNNELIISNFWAQRDWKSDVIQRHYDIIFLNLLEIVRSLIKSRKLANITHKWALPIALMSWWRHILLKKNEKHPPFWIINMCPILWK